MIPRILLLVLAWLVVHAPAAAAGTVRYQFTAGSLSPTVSDLPAGVTADALVLGSKFRVGTGVVGNLFDDGGSPDGLRISGRDGAPDTTAASFTTGSTPSFTINIPTNVTVDLQSISIEYKGTAVVAKSNARIYSSIRGHANATNETIGVFGKEASGTDAAFVVDTVNLASPRSNSLVGSSILAGDFTGLTNRSITFEIPWIDGATAASSYIDLDNLTLTLVPTSTPPPSTSAVEIAELKRLPDRSVSLSLAGAVNQPYALLAAPDPQGPVYRKRWNILKSGTFANSVVEAQDPGAASVSQRCYSLATSSLPQVRIQPVGDSITEGGSTFSVYRQPLFDKLNAAGYRFTFTGSKSSTYGTNTLQYEAYSGNNAAQIASLLAGNFPSHPADIVLIHAGHNYNTAEATLDAAATAQIVSAVEAATRSMVATCRSANPRVIVLLAQVITSGKLPKYSYIPALNARLGTLAQELNTPSSPIIAVDQASGWDPALDTVSDKVHPNAQGAEKMAQNWFAALAPLLE